jgi:hypothetical protein
MSELKDKTIEKMARYIWGRNINASWDMLSVDTRKFIEESFKEFARQMLKEIPELAIVDRCAVLTDKSYTDYSHEHNILKLNYEFKMKDGWVKEVK